ncbi:MAG: VanW family protein [Candidatus Nanopelagicales bacterium]
MSDQPGVPARPRAGSSRQRPPRSGGPGPRSTAAHELMMKRRRRTIAVGGTFLAVLVLYLVALLSGSDGVPRGTTVLGVEVGGMSREEALAAVESQVVPQTTGQIRVTAEDSSATLDPAVAGLSVDAQATVDAVAGRVWNPVDMVRHLVGTVEVAPVVVVDQAALDEQVAAFADTVDTPAVEPRLRYKDIEPRVTPGVVGRGIDRAAAAETVVASYPASAGAAEPVPLPVVDLTPTVSDETAEQVRQDVALPAVSAPVTVEVESLSLSLEPARISRALTFQPQDGTLAPVLDGARLHKALQEGLAPVETPGRNASFVIKKDRPVVVPSKVGKGVEDAALAAAVLPALTASGADRVATVAIGVREPTLTTEQAKALGIKEKLSSFTQYFPPAEYRRINVGTAAKYLNGTVLLPGETYSMNDTIKERTVENGYTEGTRIEGGRFVEDLGGGVSIITTATWTAAFFAGLERVEQRAHSLYISRYQAGLEATVAWGALDLKFRNDTPNGVLITASTSSSGVTIEMWGTKVYDDIEDESSGPYGVVEYDTVYDESDDCLAQGGVNGFSIDVDRVFYQDGEEVKRETFTTRYQPTPYVVCGPDPDTVTPSPSPSDSESGDPSQSPSDSGEASPKPSASPSPKPTATPSPKPSPKPSASGGREASPAAEPASGAA